MRVFLTGGTGLVGGHVAEQLVATGHDVRALVRASSDATRLRAIGSALVVGDMSDSLDELARRIDGCDALVHAAALVGARASRERYRAHNVAGTHNVLAAASRVGVARAVHVSSVAVYGPIDGRITEERWRERPIDARAFYAWSKREAELEAWRHDDPDGMRVSTVRPSLVFGERDRHVAPRLDRLAHLPILPLPDGGRHVLPLVYAGNVARGIVTTLERDAAAGHAYNLAQDNTTPLRDVVRAWCSARGWRPPFMPSIPGALIETAARGVDALSRAIPAIDLPGAERPARLVREDNPYDSSRARDELDWASLVPLDDAVERTVAWLRTRTMDHR